MSDIDVEESEDSGEEDDFSPNDLVFMMTPAFDIHARVDPQEFITFVLQFDRVIDEHFRSHPSGTRLEVQVAYALLPSGKKLFELQLEPPDSMSAADVDRLFKTIDQLQAPDIVGGPVTFFRRGTFGMSPSAEVSHGMPFMRFCGESETASLDDILMLAAQVTTPPSTLWNKVAKFFSGEVKPIRTLAETQILPELSKRLGRNVIGCNGVMCVSRSPTSPAT